MGKLNNLNSGITKLKSQADKQRIAEMFGIDPEILEEPEAYDPVEARERESNEAVCSAIAAVGDSVKAISMPEIPKGLATDKGFEKALKAHATVVQVALESLAKAQGDSIAAIVQQMVKDHPALIQALSALVEREEPETSEAMKFDIERDRNGFMTSVIARPVA